MTRWEPGIMPFALSAYRPDGGYPRVFVQGCVQVKTVGKIMPD